MSSNKSKQPGYEPEGQKCLLVAGFPPDLCQSITRGLGKGVDVWSLDEGDTLTEEIFHVADIAIVFVDSDIMLHRLASLIKNPERCCPVFSYSLGELSSAMFEQFPFLVPKQISLESDFLWGLLEGANLRKNQSASHPKLDLEQARFQAIYEISSNLLRISTRSQIAPALEKSLPRLLESELILLVFPLSSHPIYFMHCPGGLSDSFISPLKDHLKDAWQVLHQEIAMEWGWLDALRANEEAAQQLAAIDPTSFITTPISNGMQTEGFLTILPSVIHDLEESFLQRLFVVGDLISVLIHNLELRDQLEERATRDGLTRLYNRQTVIEMLEKECRRSQRHQEDFCLVMMDVDHFKLVNDQYGHQAGDEVLRCLAHRLESSVREVDVVGRCGGEEFIAVLVNTDLNGGRVWAEHFREQLAHSIVEFGEMKISITVSIGVSHACGDGAVADKMIRKADLALYESKRKGRNKVSVFSDDLFETMRHDSPVPLDPIATPKQE